SGVLSVRQPPCCNENDSLSSQATQHQNGRPEHLNETLDMLRALYVGVRGRHTQLANHTETWGTAIGHQRPAWNSSLSSTPESVTIPKAHDSRDCNIIMTILHTNQSS